MYKDIARRCILGGFIYVDTALDLHEVGAVGAIGIAGIFQGQNDFRAHYEFQVFPGVVITGAIGVVAWRCALG